VQTGGTRRSHNLTSDYEIVSPDEDVVVAATTRRLATSAGFDWTARLSSPAEGLLHPIDKYPRQQRSFRILAR
jgi:hypothetical protein